MTFYSPLRYPGGKTKISPFVKKIIRDNNLSGIDYIEPYAGGAGVALNLLFEDYVTNITINDSDRSIYAFWASIVNDNENFCKKVLYTPIDIQNWKKMRAIQKNKNQADIFELGFSTFYLNRTNVSGIIKGGVIGGIHQTGKYKINARFNKEILIERIQKIVAYKNRINVTNLDALKLLKSQDKKSLLYLDPPYVKKAKDLYMNFYDKKDHLMLANFLTNQSLNYHNWIVSYDISDFIMDAYKSCKSKIFWKKNYGTSNTKNGQEVIFIDGKLTYGNAVQFL